MANFILLYSICLVDKSPDGEGVHHFLHLFQLPLDRVEFFAKVVVLEVKQAEASVECVDKLHNSAHGCSEK